MLFYSIITVKSEIEGQNLIYKGTSCSDSFYKVSETSLVHLRRTLQTICLYSAFNPESHSFLSASESDQGLQRAAHRCRLMKMEAFSLVWLWAIIVYSSIETIDTRGVIRFTATASAGLAFSIAVAPHSSSFRGGFNSHRRLKKL